MNIYEQSVHNKHWTWISVNIFIIFFLFIGLGFDHFHGLGARVPVFTIVAILFGVISSYAGYRYGDRLILYSTHAGELNLDDPKQNQWQNIVGEISIAAGIPLPKTYIINDPDPNAFATGRNPENSSIVVTRGLLDTLNRDELQAVAAHEMSHIKNFDIRLMLMLAVLVGAIALVSDWACRVVFRSRSGNRRGEGNVTLVVIFIWLITVVLAPILSRMLAMFISRKREYLADASGAELTRNPLALAQALEKIDAQAAPTRSINRGTAHLCICDPKGSLLSSKEGWMANLFATHPPIIRRVEALKQMAYLK